MNKDIYAILHQLYAYFDHDKKKLIQFCIDRGHEKKDIADALGITPSALSQFIKRNMKG